MEGIILRRGFSLALVPWVKGRDDGGRISLIRDLSRGGESQAEGRGTGEGTTERSPPLYLLLLFFELLFCFYFVFLKEIQALRPTEAPRRFKHLGKHPSAAPPSSGLDGETG